MGNASDRYLGLAWLQRMLARADASGDGEDCEGEEDEEQDAERRGGVLAQRNCSSLTLV